MKYTVPFVFHNQQNAVMVDYAPMSDAPCRNLRDSKKVIWRAYTYLVDIPTRTNGNQLSYLAGFFLGIYGEHPQ